MDLFLSAVCKVFLSIVCKCSCCSRVRRGLDKAVCSEIFLFLCVGNFGFTRPIQDYSSGPGTRDGGRVLSSTLCVLVSRKQLLPSSPWLLRLFGIYGPRVLRYQSRGWCGIACVRSEKMKEKGHKKATFVMKLRISTCENMVKYFHWTRNWMSI